MRGYLFGVFFIAFLAAVGSARADDFDRCDSDCIVVGDPVFDWCAIVDPADGTTYFGNRIAIIGRIRGSGQIEIDCTFQISEPVGYEPFRVRNPSDVPCYIHVNGGVTEGWVTAKSVSKNGKAKLSCVGQT